MALLQAIEKLLLEKDAESNGKVFDHDFIQAHTEGFDALINHLKEQDAKKLAETSGVDIDDIKTIVEVLAGKSKIIACWAMGLTQHKNSVDTIKEVVNLLLLKGSIGKPGAGTCPVRGHSNVQGDRTMGIYENPSEGFINALNKSFNLELPKKAGYDTVKSIRAMKEGKVKVFVAIGGNFLSASPDTEYTAEAIRKCTLTVQVSTKLNRSHLVTGEEALILPTLGRSDKDVLKNEIQFVTTENSMGVVQMSKGSLEPVSQNLLSEPVIVARLAKEVLGNRAGKHWDKYLEHYDNIRDDIARSIDGFEDYNRRVRIPGGFYLPNVNREGQFITFTGKAAFNVAQVTTPTLNDNEYIMMTIRSHDQFNTTIYGLDDRYRGVYNERRVIFMNEKDMSRAGLSKEDQVDIYNFDGGIERVARKFIVIPYSIPEKCTATYFPETNVLVPISSTADKSNTPTSKTVKVELRKRKSEIK
jgi:molybdopterin-dependent oxidoreductase alpha subunit